MTRKNDYMCGTVSIQPFNATYHDSILKNTKHMLYSSHHKWLSFHKTWLPMLSHFVQYFFSITSEGYFRQIWCPMKEIPGHHYRCGILPPRYFPGTCNGNLKPMADSLVAARTNCEFRAVISVSALWWSGTFLRFYHY